MLSYLEELLWIGVRNKRALPTELRSPNYEGRLYDLYPVGKQAQVDRRHLGSLCDERGEQQLWGFTITLVTAEGCGGSDHGQKLGKLLRMHETVFEELGGRDRSWGPGLLAPFLTFHGQNANAPRHHPQPR